MTSNDPYVVVLGIAQDGGRPQAGCRAVCCRVADTQRRSPACLGIVDPGARQRWIIDATPDIARQLRMLDEVCGDGWDTVVDGVLLTHAHMGHYAGLVHLGREALGARSLPVAARPRMAAFLRANSPWRELMDHGHVELREFTGVVEVSPAVRVSAIPVPHRDELSDTVAFVVEGPTSRVLWLPDIDHWDGGDRDLVSMVGSVDRAYLDGTFFDDGELERDMSLIPHPRIVDTVERITATADHLASRVRFIHLNHTNPALDEGSRQRGVIESAGMGVAAEGEIFSL